MGGYLLRNSASRWSLALMIGATSFPVAAQAETTEANQAPDAAQPLPPADMASQEQPRHSDADIVVTGTRLTSGLTTPTPVTVASVQQLQAANPGLLGNALAQLPEFRNSTTASSGTMSARRENGSNFLNLRGLGVERTLVLLDGRRFVASSSTGVPNVDLFPQDLVQRVDIVTGGASAAYGSDAVAGVVNFILDKTFTGVRANGRLGISKYGDDAMRQVSLTAGTPLNGGQGHILFNAEYFKRDGIQPNSGRTLVDGFYGIANSGVASPSRIVTRPYYYQMTNGGLITSGPFANMRFLPGGTLAPFDPGTNRNATQQVGGDGVGLPFDQSAGIERYAFFSRAQHQLGSATLFAELSYAQSTSTFRSIPPQQGLTPTAFTIFSENAFLPDAIASALAPGASFTMKRVSADFGRATTNTRNRTARAIIGLDWDLGAGWKVNAYAMHGDNRYRNLIGNNVIRRNLYAAADAVIDPVSNRIVCRSTLLGFDPGCVPINLFGEGAPSADALNYVLGTSIAHFHTKEDVASATISGAPFDLPGGAFDVAAGIEYRRESGRNRVDPLTAAVNDATGVRGFPASLLNGVPGGLEYNNTQAFHGKYDIKEAFVEFNAPLLNAMPFVHLLSVNGAARVIDYSTAGTVLTWKAGVSYEPFADLRFRATRSRDIRAANLAELFTSGQTAITVVNYQGVSTPAIGLRSGNPALKPEKADTLTAGAIYRPGFIPGLGISVDYYHIKLKDAIQELTNQQTIDFCANGSSVACANITFDSSGQLTLLTPLLNLASVVTSGVDFEMTYRRRVGETDITLRGLVGYLAKQVTTVPGGAGPVDRAGDIGVAGLPKWTGSVSATIEHGSFTAIVQERYISGGKIDGTLTPAQLADNHVGAIFYTDLTLRNRFQASASRELELSLSINNLFNRNPRVVPAAPFGNYRSTNPAVYDIIGRYISVGARILF